MIFKPTAKDEKILSHICQNFFCKICNSILIQCVTLSCGHQYCNYCLDLFGQPCCPHPQCSAPIRNASPNDAVDQKIDDCIHRCSKPIQKAYTVALNARFQKSLERSKSKYDARLQQHQNSFSNDENKICPNFDDICKTLLPTNNKKPSSRGSLDQKREGLARKKSKENCLDEVDMSKVNSLFGIYDHFLQSDNEPKREMAGGDFTRESDVLEEKACNPLPVELIGMKNFTKRSSIELASLIKETDDIVRLDEHIQEWSEKMKSALGIITDPQNESSNHNELYQHNIDDELWKSSNKLMQRLRGMQEQRKSIPTHLPPLLFSPLPRSANLEFDLISDDSDVEEYEQDLNNLQKRMETTATPSKLPDETIEEEPLYREDASADRRNRTASPSPSNRRMSRKDLLKESGETYLKENIQFVTQIRKYKDALLKIQNGKVQTVQEIKELIPARVGPFPVDNSESRSRSSSLPRKRQGASKTPPPPSPVQKSGRPQLSPMKAATAQSQQQQRSMNPFSSRHSPAIPSRPRTAFEMPASSQSSSSSYQQLLSKKSIGDPGKFYMKRTRGNCRAPIYTARY